MLRIPPHRRTTVVLVAVNVLALVALNLVLAARARTDERDDAGRVAGRSASSSAPSSSTAPVATRTAKPTPRPPAAYAPGAGTGPGLTAPGVLVQAQIGADGALEVVEHVRFAAPRSRLSLDLPVTKGVLDGSLPRPVVSGLQVAADGAVVPVEVAAIADGTTLDLPAGATSVEMRYVMRDATMRSTPSTPGRALVLVPPLSRGDGVTGLPVVVEVDHTTVRNLLCPGLPASRQLCGRQASDRWYTTPLAAGSTAVVAQVDLPAPG